MYVAKTETLISRERHGAADLADLHICFRCAKSRYSHDALQVLSYGKL